MSRVRTGPRPEDWRNEEPREAHVVSRGGHLAVGVSAYDQNRATSKAYKVKQAELRKVFGGTRCGAPMPRSGTVCGRRSGHADAHRTIATLARDAGRRRVAA